MLSHNVFFGSKNTLSSLKLLRAPGTDHPAVEKNVCGRTWQAKHMVSRLRIYFDLLVDQLTIFVPGDYSTNRRVDAEQRSNHIRYFIPLL